MMTPKEVLLRGKKRLERGWCQGAPARDANGEPVRPGSRSACSFCLVGAASYNISAAIEWSAAICVDMPDVPKPTPQVLAETLARSPYMLREAQMYLDLLKEMPK